MKNTTIFKFRTYLCAVFIILIAPGIVWGILLIIFPPKDLITGITWLAGEFIIWSAFIIGFPLLFGKSYKEWLRFDTLKILKEFDNTTDRTLSGIRDELPIINQHVERDEIKDVLDQILKGKKVLLTGESGSGKSGIAAAIVKKAIKEKEPVLFLDTRHYSVTVSSLSDLQDFVNVETSLLTCIEKITNQVGSLLLVVDQLDSTIGTPASQVSVELMAHAAIKKGANIVAVGCVLETPEYQPILDLEFEEIKSKPQSRLVVSGVLTKVGVSNPSQALLSLTENLFYLGIAIELASNGNIGDIDRDFRLLEEYLRELERREGEKFVQTAVNIAYYTLLEGKFNFPRPKTDLPYFKRLIQRGLIIELGYREYRFRHEQLHYFLFVKSILEHDSDPNEIWNEFRNQDYTSLLLFALRYFYLHHDSRMKTLLDVVFIASTRFSFYDKAAYLDEMITWKEIKTLELELEPVFRAIRSEPLEKYFFNHLAKRGNSAWFSSLRDRGFFSSPPEPVEVDDGVRYPLWPAVLYLEAILPQLPEEVIKVAEQIQLVNAYWMSDLVMATTQIPATYAPRVVKLAISWLDLGMLFHHNSKELFQFWAQAEQWEPFLTFIDFILTSRAEPVSEDLRHNRYYSPRAKFRFEEYFIEQFLKADLPKLLDPRCIDILKILENKLIQAMLIESLDDHTNINSYWRSAIEPSEQNMGDRCKDLLLTSARDALDHLFEMNSESAVGIVDEYLCHRFTIFHRLAIYAIREHMDVTSKHLPQLYSDPKYWENSEYYHDYWLFTSQTFIAISNEQQIAYVERLLGELDREAEDEEKQPFSRPWVYRRLWAIRNYLPTSEAQSVFNELQSEFGDPDPPEWFGYLAYSRGVQWGSPSSKSVEDLLQMTPKELLQELKKPFPTHSKSFYEPTLEGLATELGSAIKSNPAHFDSIASELFSDKIHPTFVSHALRGFGDAWKEKQDFVWVSVIELCQKVSQTQESSLDDEVPVDMLHNYWEGTYASARKAVVGLLGKAVINDDNAIEHQYLEDVRNILMQLCDDLNPSQEYEAKWGTAQGRDYLNLALNVIRADAIKSLIHYALHLARVVEKDEAVSHLLPTGIRIEPDVLEKLIEKLDKNNDPAKSVHLNFGLYLPNLIYLDKKIFLSHLEDIFPRDVEKIDYWEAAWDGYMFRSEFFGGLYSHLKPYYYYALDQLEDSIDGRAGSENSQHRIAGHFALLYSNGEETFNDENSLVKRFFAIASDDLRATFVKALSPSPAKDPIESESDEWQRLKEFLNWRYASIQDAGNPDDYKKELATFLLWVPHLPEPLENFYEIIEASVLVAEPPYLISLFEYLVKVVDEHTRFVMCLYEKNIMRGFPPYFRGARDEEVQIILETAIKSDDEESKDSAIRVINHFGERGDDRYRSLLKIT